MTLRCFLIILSFWVSYSIQAQMYRVYFVDKGVNTIHNEDTPVCNEYIAKLSNYCDSVWMSSKWLNYTLIQHANYPYEIESFSFVKYIEPVESTTSFKLLEVNNGKKGNSKFMEEYRTWQLDTLGYSFFNRYNYTGKNVTIAIIDAGFAGANESNAFKHIYSNNKVIKTWDFIDNDSNVYHGATHGTMVWSCIAGNMDNKPTGLALDAHFILFRTEDQKTETMADEDRWVQAIEKAYELGADIVNSSVGFSNTLHKKSDLNGQSIISKAAEIASQKGMMVVVSAGNEFITAWKTLCTPADAEGVITVGGIDKNGNQSYFSSVGPTADGRFKPNVVGPGTCVVVNGNNFSLANGTSFSAPLITGYLACMMEWKGKGNFTRDSIKFYAGLFPYFDCVYGYGVPFSPMVKVDTAYKKVKCSWPEINKENKTVANNSVLVAMNPKCIHTIFIKIVDVNGKIKFSKRYVLKGNKTYKIATTKNRNAFIHSKYMLPNAGDKWYVWTENCYHEYGFNEN